MTSKYKHLNDAKAAIKVAIGDAIATRGVFTICTCDKDYFGWDKLEHETMLWLERMQPNGWLVRGYREHGTVKWTVVEV